MSLMLRVSKGLPRKPLRWLIRHFPVIRQPGQFELIAIFFVSYQEFPGHGAFCACLLKFETWTSYYQE